MFSKIKTYTTKNLLKLKTWVGKTRLRITIEDKNATCEHVCVVNGMQQLKVKPVVRKLKCKNETNTRYFVFCNEEQKNKS